METYDAKVNLSEPQPRSAVQQELEKMPGLERVEPLIELPVSINHHWNEEEVILMGLTRQSTLYNILVVDNRRVLGMTFREVLSVITFEQWFLSFFAIIASKPYRLD